MSHPVPARTQCPHIHKHRRRVPPVVCASVRLRRSARCLCQSRDSDALGAVLELVFVQQFGLPGSQSAVRQAIAEALEAFRPGDDAGAGDDGANAPAASTPDRGSSAHTRASSSSSGAAPPRADYQDLLRRTVVTEQYILRGVQADEPLPAHPPWLPLFVVTERVVALWKQLHLCERTRTPVLIVGAVGCGKSEAFRAYASYRRHQEPHTIPAYAQVLRVCVGGVG